MLSLDRFKFLEESCPHFVQFQARTDARTPSRSDIAPENDRRFPVLGPQHLLQGLLLFHGQILLVAGNREAVQMKLEEGAKKLLFAPGTGPEFFHSVSAQDAGDLHVGIGIHFFWPSGMRSGAGRGPLFSIG